MHANIVTLNYKSPEDLETVVQQLSKEAENFDSAPGFKAIYMVRTSPTQTVHTVVFDNEENLNTTREKMFPVLQQIAGPHITGPPEQTPGPVVLDR